jgi:hypothetical protein
LSIAAIGGINDQETPAALQADVSARPDRLCLGIDMVSAERALFRNWVRLRVERLVSCIRLGKPPMVTRK